MRVFLAIFLPFICFFTIRKYFQGIVCLLLQITLIGWIPAAIWAMYALSNWKTDQKFKKWKMEHPQKTAKDQWREIN